MFAYPSALAMVCFFLLLGALGIITCLPVFLAGIVPPILLLACVLLMLAAAIFSMRFVAICCLDAGNRALGAIRLILAAASMLAAIPFFLLVSFMGSRFVATDEVVRSFRDANGEFAENAARIEYQELGVFFDAAWKTALFFAAVCVLCWAFGMLLEKIRQPMASGAVSTFGTVFLALAVVLVAKAAWNDAMSGKLAWAREHREAVAACTLSETTRLAPSLCTNFDVESAADKEHIISLSPVGDHPLAIGEEVEAGQSVTALDKTDSTYLGSLEYRDYVLVMTDSSVGYVPQDVLVGYPEE